MKCAAFQLHRDRPLWVSTLQRPSTLDVNFTETVHFGCHLYTDRPLWQMERAQQRASEGIRDALQNEVTFGDAVTFGKKGRAGKGRILQGRLDAALAQVP